MHRGGGRPITGLSGISLGAARRRAPGIGPRAPARYCTAALAGTRWQPLPPLAPAPTPTHARTRTRCHACPEPGSHARGDTLAALALGGLCGAQRRHRQPRSPGDPETGIERPLGLGDRELCPEQPEASGRETPCEPWTHNCHSEAPGTRAGVPERSPASPALRAVRGPSLRVPGGQGGRGPERPPRPGWQLRRSGTKSFKYERWLLLFLVELLCLVSFLPGWAAALITQRPAF